MLNLLHIENIAIIEQADIVFEPGFNALTGETGAGKSIVIDSLSAVLGQRTSRDLIRTGSDKAFVSACFSNVPAAIAQESGIDSGDELLLQREIHGDGRNICRINGRPATVAQLRALGTSLLNIHGQHDGQQLLDEEQHILYLDSFGRVQPLLDTYREAYHQLSDLRRQIQALQMDEGLGCLSVAVTVSPFLGLFGTVWGVMSTFCSIASSGRIEINLIAPGISGALLTTVMGLFVAIPAVTVNTVINAYINAINMKMDIFVDDFVTGLTLEETTSQPEQEASNPPAEA